MMMCVMRVCVMRVAARRAAHTHTHPFLPSHTPNRHQHTPTLHDNTAQQTPTPTKQQQNNNNNANNSKSSPQLVAHLDAEGVDFLQFAFRWVNCLLIREVPLGAATRLWDTYLSEGPMFSEFLVYACAALLTTWERPLGALEFQELMLFLQRLPTGGWGEAEVELVLSRAYVLRDTWGGAGAGAGGGGGGGGAGAAGGGAGAGSGAGGG